jgi:superoxide reductase
MQRRDFLKGVVFGTALLASREAQAIREYSGYDMKNFLRSDNRINPSVLEKSHVPAIDAPWKVKKDEWFEVKVRVGYMKAHPSEPKHWIDRIAILVDGMAVAETDFKIGGIFAPEALFKIRLNKTSAIKAIEHCNLHGSWTCDPVTISVI